MVDREKVMQWLKICANGCEDGCPYEYKNLVYRVECKADLMSDALELLKEQEPVAHATWLCEETSTAYDLYGVKTWAAKYKCSKCGSVHRAIEAHMCYSYCPMCGARMDEDAKEGET